MEPIPPVRYIGHSLCGLAVLAHAAPAFAEAPVATTEFETSMAPVDATAQREAPMPFLELRGHLALGDADRVGASVEPALLYRWRRFDIGVGVQLLGLWANDDMPLSTTYPERAYRDLTVLPRAALGYGSRDGFWRMQLAAGYGPTWMRARGGSPPLPPVERTHWSYGVGLGFFAGVFHAEVQWLGYLRHAEEGWSTTFDAGSVDTRGGVGQVTSLGVAFPIALDGAAVSSEPR